MTWWPPYPYTSGVAPWASGLSWRTDIVSTDQNFLAIDVPFMRDRVLRAYTEGVEDGLIEHYIKAATAFGERLRGEHITPKVMTLTLDAFPSGPIEFTDGPVLSVASVGYTDGNGDSQIYGGSPPSWVFQSGGRSRRGRISLGYGESWPTAQAVGDAVVVTFSVGYETPEDVPADIKQAIAVTAGEFYKNPDLSNSDGQAANVLTIERFWPRRWSNGL